MKNLKTFTQHTNESMTPVLYGYIPFYNKYVNKLSKILINKIENDEISVSSKINSHSLNLGFDNFKNVLLIKGILSTSNFKIFSVIIDSISFGSLTTYMLALNDGTDDVIFLSKNDGKKLFDLCKNKTQIECGKMSVDADTNNISTDKELEQKVKNIIDNLSI